MSNRDDAIVVERLTKRYGNLLAVISDISERKRAEQEIHELNIGLEQRLRLFAHR